MHETWAAIMAWVAAHQKHVCDTWDRALSQHWQPVTWDVPQEAALAHVCHELVALDHVLQPILRFFMTGRQYEKYVPQHVQRRDAALIARTPLLVVYGKYDGWKLGCLNMLPTRDLPLALWLHTPSWRTDMDVPESYEEQHNYHYLVQLGHTLLCEMCTGLTGQVDRMFPSRYVTQCTKCRTVRFDVPNPNKTKRRSSLARLPNTTAKLACAVGLKERRVKDVSVQNADCRARIALGLVPGIDTDTMLRTPDIILGVPDGRLACDQSTWAPEWCNALLTSVDTLILHVPDSDSACPRPLTFLDPTTTSMVGKPKIHLVVQSLQTFDTVCKTWPGVVRSHICYVTIVDDVSSCDLSATFRDTDVRAVRVKCTPEMAWLVLQGGCQYLFEAVCDTTQDEDDRLALTDNVCGTTFGTDAFRLRDDYWRLPKPDSFSYVDMHTLFQRDTFRRRRDVLHTLNTTTIQC